MIHKDYKYGFMVLRLMYDDQIIWQERDDLVQEWLKIAQEMLIFFKRVDARSWWDFQIAETKLVMLAGLACICKYLQLHSVT